MTRSKIQKMKFFVFLLIFLLAQTAICDANFRERKDATVVDKKVSLVDEKADKKVDEPSARIQQSAAGSSSDAKKPATDSNKTHDGITLKPSPDVNANKTHIADNEVRIFVSEIESSHEKFLVSWMKSSKFTSVYH